MGRNAGYFAGVLFAVVFFAVVINTVSFAEMNAASKEEDLYRQAMRLKSEGNYSAASDVLKGLSDRGDSVRAEIAFIDLLLDQSIEMKEADNSAWKLKAKEAGARIKAVQAKRPADADFYLVWAKYSWLVESKRESNITKALEKAFYYKPNYTYAYIVKGDIYGGLARNTDIAETRQDASLTGGGAAPSARHTLAMTAKRSYETALSASDIDNAWKAYVHYKLGNLEDGILGNNTEARANWQKAASLSAESKWGKLAKKRLE